MADNSDNVKSRVYRQLFTEFSSLLADAGDFTDVPALRYTPTVFDFAFARPCLEGVDRRALFMAVKRWALDALQEDLPTALATPAFAPEVREVTARECRGVLANAFLGNVRDPMEGRKRNTGGLDFSSQFQDGSHPRCMGTQKTAALLLYFHGALALEGTEDDSRVVRFEYLKCPSVAEFQQVLATTGAGRNGEGVGAHVRLHSAGMEAPPAAAFVNFANANFGYGKFIPSCTQEEILQMCCPEFNVGMLFLGVMDDDEVVVVHACRRFSTYSGYLDTYACEGPHTDAATALQDVLTIDACTRLHFSTAANFRDVRKAYTAFAAVAARRGAGAVVSTGRWGCGVFGGTPAHKLAQQAVAACAAGVALEFSTFGQPEGCDEVVAALQARPVSVVDAWRAVLRCDRARTCVSTLVETLAAGGEEGEGEGGERAAFHRRGDVDMV